MNIVYIFKFSNVFLSPNPEAQEDWQAYVLKGRICCKYGRDWNDIETGVRLCHPQYWYWKLEVGWWCPSSACVSIVTYNPTIFGGGSHLNLFHLQKKLVFTCLLPRKVERREWSRECRTSMSGKAPSTVRMAFSILIGGFDHLTLNVMFVHNHHNSIFINLLSLG